MSASALERRYGVGSLAHRAGSAVACGSAWQTVVFVARVARSRYGHPLRFYIRPHFRKCGAVVALKLHLVPHTAARPDGFPKQALCKVAFAGYGRTAVGAPPVAGTRPTRRRLRALVVCLHRGISQALRASFWSVACGQSCCVCPAHLGPRRCAALACAVCPSAPKGLPQPTRKLGGAALTRHNFKSHPLSRRVKYTTTETFLKMTVLLTVLFRIKH